MTLVAQKRARFPDRGEGRGRSIFPPVRATIAAMTTSGRPPRPNRRDPRSWAVDILARVNGSGAFVSHELAAAMASPDLGGHERNLLQQLVKGVLENRTHLDQTLEPYLPKGLDSLPLKVREALRLGAYQILFLDRIHAGTAVNASVALTKVVAGPRLGNVVNAVLRRLLREGPSSTAEVDPVRRIAREQSHPEWLVAHWAETLGFGETEELCRCNNARWKLGIRMNTVRASREDCWARLVAEGVVLSPGRWFDDSAVIERIPPGLKLDELASFREGLFVVHDESSALIARLVDPQPGETILDVCAAPGGKTTHLAALTGDAARIVACDRSALRLKLVVEACARLGIRGVATRVASAESLSLEAPVDRVLVDAPCSGLGVIGRRPDIRWHRRPEKFAEFHALQGTIVRAAARHVKIGGRLIYSTCTTARIENEETVRAFLADSPNFKLVGAGEAARTLPRDVVTPEGYVRTWPHRHQMGGAFGAVMERIA